MFGRETDRDKILIQSPIITGYGADEYIFLEEHLHVNDYQFGLIFQAGRGMGTTWAFYMGLMLKCKKEISLSISPETFRTQDDTTNMEAKNQYKKFILFIEEYFLDNYEMTNVQASNFSLIYTGKIFKKKYPDLHI